MPSNNLVNAASEMGESVLELDAENLAAGTAGVAVGALGAEVAGDRARSFLSGRRGITRDVGDVGARVGTGAGMAFAQQSMDLGPLAEVILGFGAFTASATGFVRGVEVVLERTGAFGSNASPSSSKTKRAPTSTSSSTSSSTSGSSRNRSSRVSMSSPTSGGVLKV